MPKRVTLKDVAVESGVSYQTVSKVLNGTATVSDSTRAAVLDAARLLGYRPNAAARGLRTQSSALIGYSWRPAPHAPGNPVLEHFLTSTVEAAEEQGYHLLLFPRKRLVSRISWEQEPGRFGGEADRLAQASTYRDLITTSRVDGFILSSVEHDDARIQMLREQDFPFVAFGRANVEWDFPYVDIDGRQGIFDATSHLIEQGHERIALLGWPRPSMVGAVREAGYHDAMRNAGLDVYREWVLHLFGTIEAGTKGMRTLLALPTDRRPTAVVCLNDYLAIGAYQVLREAGLTIGKDFGVSGFDDIPIARHLAPPLTSVRQPLDEAGRLVVEMIVALVNGESLAQSQRLLSPTLVVRQSTRPNTSDS